MGTSRYGAKEVSARGVREMGSSCTRASAQSQHELTTVPYRITEATQSPDEVIVERFVPKHVAGHNHLRAPETLVSCRADGLGS